MPEQLNYSNNVLTMKDIEGLIGLFEGDGIFDFWKANVCSPDISDTDAANLRRNFPRANYLREVVLKLCWSIPIPKVKVSHELAGHEELEAKIKELLERKHWEGQKNFWAALPWWRAFVFVTGDVCVKLPMVDGIVKPERLPSQLLQIKTDPDVRKKITAYRFRYLQGNSTFTDQGENTLQVIETISEGSWTIERNGVTEDVPTRADLLPISHLAWEEREDFPRGLPLALRLADKLLHVLTAALDRRLGNKMGSVPMYVLKNAQGTLPARAPGAVISLKQENPWAVPDFTAVSSSFSDASLRSEYVDALRELHEAAFLPFELDQQGQNVGPQSGKAIQLLSKDQVKYRESYQVVEASFLEEVIIKSLALEGTVIKPGDICVEYESMISPDPNERRADAQFYLDAGLTEEALTTMGKDEDEAQKLAVTIEDKKAEQLLTMAGADKPNPADNLEDKTDE